MTTNEEKLAAKYASYTDEELNRRIAHEESLIREGYKPDEPDLKKRGFDPETCLDIITEIASELIRRSNAK